MKEIANFPNYFVSVTGKVYSQYRFKYLKELKQTKTVYGYMVVSLINENGKSSKRVHRLIAEAFIPNPENKLTVNHKNGDKTDNHIDNLEWMTQQENCLHNFRVLGRKPTISMLGRLGKDCPNSKTVQQLSLQGEFIKEFGSTAEAFRETGIGQSHISSCARNNQGTAGGYKWRYV